MTWQDAPFLTYGEYERLPRGDRQLLDSQQNKWQWDWELKAFVNAEHPDNDEWRQMREAMEARAMLG